jgi:hypothetical protein
MCTQEVSEHIINAILIANGGLMNCGYSLLTGLILLRFYVRDNSLWQLNTLELHFQMIQNNYNYRFIHIKNELFSEPPVPLGMEAKCLRLEKQLAAPE